MKLPICLLCRDTGSSLTHQILLLPVHHQRLRMILLRLMTASLARKQASKQASTQVLFSASTRRHQVTQALVTTDLEIHPQQTPWRSSAVELLLHA